MTSEGAGPMFTHHADLPRLKRAAFDAICSAGNAGASSQEIARSFLVQGPMPEKIAQRIASALLSGDGRVELGADGRWKLRIRATASKVGTPLSAGRYCVVDVETTGVTNDACMIEIGAVHVNGLDIGPEFSSLINVQAYIPPEITVLTGITQEMVDSAPAPEEVLRRFREFLGDRVFCAHNAPFDRRFVFREMEAFRLERLENPVLCTRLLARRSMPEIGSYSLETLQKRFRIAPMTVHRGLPDAYGAAKILKISVERLMEAGFETVEEIIAAQTKKAFDRRLKERGSY